MESSGIENNQQQQQPQHQQQSQPPQQSSQHANQPSNMNDNMEIVKEEKSVQCKFLNNAQLGLQEVKGGVMDVRTADGSIGKLCSV